MTWAVSMFALAMLLDPSEKVDAAAAAAVSADADRFAGAAAAGPVMTDARRSRARITGDTADCDRESGIVLFEGNARVEYGDEYVLKADRLYAFMSESNEFSRVVATGAVEIENESRRGTCGAATYRRARREIEMFAGEGVPAARLEEADGGAVEGSRIKFWLDTEQVEVEDAKIAADGAEGGLL